MPGAGKSRATRQSIQTTSPIITTGSTSPQPEVLHSTITTAIPGCDPPPNLTLNGRREKEIEVVEVKPVDSTATVGSEAATDATSGPEVSAPSASADHYLEPMEEGIGDENSRSIDTLEEPMYEDSDHDSGDNKKKIFWSAENEKAFFQALVQYKPLGTHRHFNMLLAAHTIQSEVGQDLNVNELWKHVNEMYCIDELETQERARTPAVPEIEFELQGSDYDDLMQEVIKAAAKKAKVDTEIPPAPIVRENRPLSPQITAFASSKRSFPKTKGMKKSFGKPSVKSSALEY